MGAVIAHDEDLTAGLRIAVSKTSPLNPLRELVNAMSSPPGGRGSRVRGKSAMQ